MAMDGGDELSKKEWMMKLKRSKLKRTVGDFDEFIDPADDSLFWWDKINDMGLLSKPTYITALEQQEEVKQL